MGTLVGHVAPGFGFLIIGFWHLINHIRLHTLNPSSYTFFPWFPTSRMKYLELFLIIGGCLTFICMELIIGIDRHQALDPDGTIPSHHLHKFEHSNIAMSYLIYAIFSILLDKVETPVKHGLTQLLGAIALAEQLLVFHFHSADHKGVEGQYHLLLEKVIFVSLVTTLLGFSHENGFLKSFVRSLSILLQGVWLIVTGFMLYTPSLVPKGCYKNLEEGHHVIRCDNHQDLERAKSLVTMQFSWYLIGVTIFGMSLYLVTVICLGEGKVDYQRITKFEEKIEEEDDVETQENKNVGGKSRLIPD